MEQEKEREKEKVGGRPAKLNEKKGDGDLKKKQFCSGGATNNARWKWAAVQKSERKHVRHFLHKTCN